MTHNCRKGAAPGAFCSVTPFPTCGVTVGLGPAPQQVAGFTRPLTRQPANESAFHHMVITGSASALLRRLTGPPSRSAPCSVAGSPSSGIN